jgi:hypothetical protein
MMMVEGDISADFDGLGGWIPETVCLPSLAVADENASNAFRAQFASFYLWYMDVGHVTENS